MQVVDWMIVAGLLIVLLIGALSTRRHTRSVSAFLAANRCGGRYLISMANAMAGLGVISLVYWFEIYYEAGYTAYWWGAMTEPALIILALSGWVIYRFRQTRAMTLAQFFEMRYSRNFRVFAGLVAYVSGIINFGIFPAVGARFFIALCGLPPNFEVAGFECSTFVTLIIALLATSLLFTFLGGQVAVMVTDFLQGVFANVVFAAVMIFMLLTFNWEQMTEVMLQAPQEKSLIHPMHIGEQSHYNIWFFLISVAIVLYSVMGWQGTQAYYCCAKNAHEAKMANILNGWRFRVLLLIALITPIAVRTMLYHPDFAPQAAMVQQAMSGIEADTAEQVSTLQNQLRTPYALSVMLPTGLLGLMCAAMLAAFISTHDTYLHSWGSIFVQDVILPFRKKPFSTRQHLWLLRASIFGVAVFIFLSSLLIKPTQFVSMFLAITGAVFVGGAGSAIIGGLYWRRGTTSGAWAAMLTGMIFSCTGIIIKQIDESTLIAWQETLPSFVKVALYIKMNITGQELTFWAIVSSIFMYVFVSLVRPGKIFNLDRMLHRGKFAVEGDNASPITGQKSWLEKLGMDRQFTGRDRLVTYISIGWPLAWTLLFIVGTIYNLFVDVPDESWLSFWRGWTWVVLCASIAVTGWFTIGGIGDLKYLYRNLAKNEAGPDDDGRVAAVDDDLNPE